MIIKGFVSTGEGGVSKLPIATLELRRKETGMSLVPGTLNVTPFSPIQEILPDIDKIDHGFTVDAPHPSKGRLRYWNAVLFGNKLPQEGVKCVLVRLERSGAYYLELMAPVSFRSQYELMDYDHVDVHVSKWTAGSSYEEP